MSQFRHSRCPSETGPFPHDNDPLQHHVGYCKALEEAGVALDESLVCVADFRELGGQLAMEEPLAAPERPEAVLVTNHVMMIGVLQAIVQSRLAIPADTAVVSFDDTPWPALEALAHNGGTTRLRHRDRERPAVAEPARRLQGCRQVVILSPSLKVRGLFGKTSRCRPALGPSPETY